METGERPQGDVKDDVNSLGDIVPSEHELDDIAGHVARIALGQLEGWEASATTLFEENKVATYGTTDPKIQPVDQAQYDGNAGPCVDAARTGEVRYWDGTNQNESWAEFAAAAKKVGIRSVASFPLILGDQPLGALNFYSRTVNALSDGQREEGLLFASQASVALANARNHATDKKTVGNLVEAIQTRTVIGQATGLLMAREELTSEEAFQRLVKVSQAANVKLREIAMRYVKAWESKVSARTPGERS